MQGKLQEEKFSEYVHLENGKLSGEIILSTMLEI
jgi:hypothetical protein